MRLRFGPFVLDVPSRTLRRDDRAIHLTPKAFDLLALLAGAAPRVVPKAEIHQHLWPSAFVSEANLTGLIKELRQALDDRASDARMIRTVHGVGYAVNAAVRTEVRDVTGTLHWLVLRDRRVALQAGENRIGRTPAAEVWLDSAGVSRQHARIVVDGSEALLEDCGSKNGTMRADNAVRGSVLLQDGDRLAFGSVDAVYRSSLHDGSTQTRSRSTSATTGDRLPQKQGRR